MSEERIIELEQQVKADPSCDAYVELAQLLSVKPESRIQAREVCFRGLTANPSNAMGRLVLAKLFYLDGMMEFCARELRQLRQISSAPSLDKLLRALGEREEAEKQCPGEQVSSAETAAKSSELAADEELVVAEADFDLDFSEAIEELEKK